MELAIQTFSPIEPWPGRNPALPFGYFVLVGRGYAPAVPRDRGLEKRGTLLDVWRADKPSGSVRKKERWIEITGFYRDGSFNISVLSSMTFTGLFGQSFTQQTIKSH